ncbi:mandelate racemase/muconate lactonizing enzyme family protein [Nocardioides sp. LHD-245]|uniref:mandelate racemase/muconate lactonizing enzyme family protein n=1 Tax=Nocardioides sp. LHD-245 TaxID=3051387 RepID=UPI0027E21761|nr:mandelate racemase/muconate lactonizing enzyme family protein [Nocardioides sp. LHD-245]
MSLPVFRVEDLRVYEFEFDGLPHAMVRVRLDQGVTGFGEASDGYGFAHPGLLRTIVQEVLAPLLGRPGMVSVPQVAGLLKSELRRRPGLAGPVGHAVSAVEMALWDAVGRRDGLSVRSMLGGHRERLGVYASSHFLFQGDADWHVHNLEPWLARGVGAVKLRLGLDWRTDLATLAQVRDRLGPTVDIFVDGTEHYSLDTALRVSRALADLGVSMFEEPIPQERHLGVQRLVDQSAVAIGYGEHFGMSGEYDRAIRDGRADVLQPDPATSGGLLEMVRIGELAELASVPVMPHSAAGPVAFAANLHASSALKTLRLVEFPYSMAEPWHEILDSNPFTLEHLDSGAFVVPTGPGLGIEVDEAALVGRSTRVADIEVPASTAAWTDWSQGNV